jgi:exopolysaccharide production protein ExoZ
LSLDDAPRPGTADSPSKGPKVPATLTVLQLGRGFAALGVAAFHLSNYMGEDRYGGDPVLQNWTGRGSLGVDFFFVLSGFIILMAHYDDIGRPARLRRYAWRRFIRVYPIYWIYTSVFVVLVLILDRGTTMPTTLSGWLSAFTLIRFSPESPPLPQAWTLFHEIGFYAVFAIFIVNRRIGFGFLTLWLTVCAVTWHYSPENQPLLAVYTSAYSFHFVLGMLAYLAYRHLHWRACVAIGMVAFAMAFVEEARSGQENGQLWACGFAGLVLAFASVEHQFGIHVAGWLRYIGDSSYSLYLLHFALELILLKVAVKVKLVQYTGGLATFFIVLTSVTLLSCLAYRLVEQPILRALRPGLRFRPRSA